MADAMKTTTQGIERTNPPGLVDPSSRGYSHVAVAPAGWRAIYIAGQGGEDETGVFADDFKGQARLTFSNLKTALEAAGATPAHVVKTTVLIVDPSFEKMAAYSAAREEIWGPNANPPGTLIPVTRLALPQMQIEIDAVAFAPPR